MAALAWERERAAADASALRVAEAEHFLRVSSGQLPVDPEPGASSSRQAPPAGSGARYDPTDLMVAQLHLQAAGVQNIRALVSILLDPASSSPFAATPSTTTSSSTRRSRRGTWHGCASTASPCPGSSGPSP